MTVVSITEAKNKLTQIVHDVENGEPVELTRHGVPTAVLLSFKNYIELAEKSSSFLSLMQSFRVSNGEYLLEEDNIFSGLRSSEAGRNVNL